MLPFACDFVADDETLLTDYNPAFVDIWGTMQILSNAAGNATDGETSCVAYQGDVFGANQYAQGVVAALDGSVVGVAIRAQGAGTGKWVGFHSSDDHSTLAIWDAGSAMVLAGGGAPVSVGDLMRIEVIDDIFTAYVNGVPWLGPVLDTTLTLGYGGVEGFSAGFPGSLITDFETGNIGSESAAGAFMPCLVPGL